jgi:hypothetical protein
MFKGATVYVCTILTVLYRLKCNEKKIKTAVKSVKIAKALKKAFSIE